MSNVQCPMSTTEQDLDLGLESLDFELWTLDVGLFVGGFNQDLHAAR